MSGGFPPPVALEIALRVASGRDRGGDRGIVEKQGNVCDEAATFGQPGEYLIRVRADNFGRVDSSAGDQCCWTNGYVKVTVTS